MGTREIAERVQMVNSFFAKVRRADETVGEWKARVDNDQFRAEHKALWEHGVCI